ncbi:hypothetical protein R4575_18100 [Acinetobacter baumannii]|nr:hypothetical protein [Acinetobacter baumannii]
MSSVNLIKISIDELKESLKSLSSDRNDKIIKKLLVFADCEQFNHFYSPLAICHQIIGYIIAEYENGVIDEDERIEYEQYAKNIYELKEHYSYLNDYTQEKAQAAIREKVGIVALKRLLNENLNEYGSGAYIVKRVLLSLFNGSRYSIDLTQLRNLDSQNFDDVIAVLEMNARSFPKQEIFAYIENGREVWAKMAKDLEGE